MCTNGKCRIEKLVEEAFSNLDAQIESIRKSGRKGHASIHIQYDCKHKENSSKSTATSLNSNTTCSLDNVKTRNNKKSESRKSRSSRTSSRSSKCSVSSHKSDSSFASTSTNLSWSKLKDRRKLLDGFLEKSNSTQNRNSRN
uniref:Uncharacterized protein n=1 Tax=Bursaphelenchus xylophilus TaxID=6326 RepID=A0A1I7SD14_BURXY